MSSSDDLSVKIQSERHLQTVLLAAITIGVTVVSAMLLFIWGAMAKLQDSDSDRAAALARLEGTQTIMLSTQAEFKTQVAQIVANSYTGSQARDDLSAIRSAISGIQSDQRETNARLRAVETTVARLADDEVQR